MAHLRGVVTRERRRQLDLGEVPTPSTPRPDAGLRSGDEQELVEALNKMPIGAEVGTKMLKAMGNSAKFSGREKSPNIAWKKLLLNIQRILPQYHPCFRPLCSVDHASEDAVEVQHDAIANSKLYDVIWSLLDEPAQLVLDGPELEEGRDGHRALIVLNMRYTQQGCQEIAQLEYGMSELYRTINRTCDPQDNLREMGRLFRALCSANGVAWTEKGSLQKATMLLGAQYDWLKREFDRGLHQSTAAFERVLMNDWLEFGNSLARDKSNAVMALASMTLERDKLAEVAASSKIRPPDPASPAPRRQKEDARRAEQDGGGRGRDAGSRDKAPPRAEKKDRPRGEEGKRKVTCFICKKEHRAEVCPYSDDVAKMVANMPQKEVKAAEVAAAARENYPVEDDYGHDCSDNEYGHIATAVYLRDLPEKLLEASVQLPLTDIPKSFDAAMVDEHDRQMRAEQEAWAESVVDDGSLDNEPSSALTDRLGGACF